MKIGFIIYPMVTALDFVGPSQLFASLSECEILLISKTLAPLKTDAGFSVNPTHTIDDAPQLDIICVPGGFGQHHVANDECFMDFIKKQGNSAKYVTSVCSGSLILAKAGLLDGYSAACHWVFRDELAQYGVTSKNDRVVIDGNRITGGGVTAGIDFGLTIIGKVFGEERAKLIQLSIEYNPSPPFDCGSPEAAGKERAEMVKKHFHKALQI